MTKVPNLRANKTKQNETPPNEFGHKRTTTETHKTDSETLPSQSASRKTVPEKAHSRKFKLQQAQCPKLPSPSDPQRTKNARNTHDEHTPLLELNVHRSEVRRHRRLETSPSTMLPYLLSKPGTNPTALQRFSHISMSLQLFVRTVGWVGNTFPMFQGQAAPFDGGI